MEGGVLGHRLLKNRGVFTWGKTVTWSRNIKIIIWLVTKVSPDSRGSGRRPEAGRNRSEQQGRRVEEGSSLSCSLVEVGAVVRPLDVNPPHTPDPLPLSLLVFIQVVGASRRPACGLQKCVVRSSAVLGLVQQNIEGLLINPGLWELYLHSHRTQGRGVSITRPPPTSTSAATWYFWAGPLAQAPGIPF